MEKSDLRNQDSEERDATPVEASENSRKSQERGKKSGKNRATKFRAKFLDTYYGHPMKDMKLIAITGTAGKVEVAHFVHEILRAAGQPVAIMASESNIKVAALHKFLSKAWKAGANYVVVTAPAEALEGDVFYGLPIHVAAITDYMDASIAETPVDDYVEAGSTLFKMDPDYVVLNRDDKNYPELAAFAGQKGTLTYGRDKFSNIQIEDAALYKKGVEAELAIGTTHFTVASFLPGEPVVSYMAAATAIADALHVTPEKIAEGIANYTTKS
ncbi:hypothetical protein IJH19_02735 [Candidatus Saccharibacteria bacterium]|nr:hypothetical protein [Candidatus Saccharibacteria bacterium]